MFVKVKRVGGSMAVVIPAPIASEMNLSAGTALAVSLEDDKLVLRKSRRPRRSMDQLVAEIDPAAYKRRRKRDLDDKPVGREIW